MVAQIFVLCLFARSHYHQVPSEIKQISIYQSVVLNVNVSNMARLKNGHISMVGSVELTKCQYFCNRASDKKGHIDFSNFKSLGPRIDMWPIFPYLGRLLVFARPCENVNICVTELQIKQALVKLQLRLKFSLSQSTHR